MEQNEKHVCSICGKAYTGYGNNAEPINAGRCCNQCDVLVIKKRIDMEREAVRERFLRTKHITVDLGTLHNALAEAEDKGADVTAAEEAMQDLMTTLDKLVK